MARFAADYVPPNAREFRANGLPKVGSFTRGNRNSSFLGRTITPGIVATVANPAGPRPKVGFRPKPKSAETLRNEEIERRVQAAKPCVGCGMKVYVARTCFCW